MKAPLTLALVLAAGLVAGCSRNAGNPLAPANGTTGGGSGGADDQTEVTGTMASVPDLMEDGQFESADPTTVDGAPAGALAAIRPLSFYRNITSVERRFEFAFADTDSTGRPTTAIVTVHKLLAGTFNIVVGPATDGVRDTSRLRVVRKRLADHWVRRVLLKRVPPPPTLVASEISRPRWRVAASSAVEVTSRAATTRIVSLEIKTATRDTVLTDPLVFFRLHQIMKFDAGEEVTLIATTERSDDVVVLLRGRLRARFQNNGDNTYTLLWHAPERRGLHHVGVNALSHGTLFDDVAPYDSKAWILPYVVSPAVLAEYMP
ncbi:MAG TPA: hypothetical protein VGK89_01360 [Candidatus Eisenbacteria bacterium]|jgi:hypothetical protein